MNQTKKRSAGIRRASAGNSLRVTADPATMRRLEWCALVAQHLAGRRESNATLARAAIKMLSDWLSERLECADPLNRGCAERRWVEGTMNAAARGDVLRWPESLLDESGEPMTLDELREAGRDQRTPAEVLRDADRRSFPGEARNHE